MNEEDESKDENRRYHNKWQNERYHTNEEFRKKKIKNSVEWRENHLKEYRAYQKEYQRKRRKQNGTKLYRRDIVSRETSNIGEGAK